MTLFLLRVYYVFIVSLLCLYCNFTISFTTVQDIENAFTLFHLSCPFFARIKILQFLSFRSQSPRKCEYLE